MVHMASPTLRAKYTCVNHTSFCHTARTTLLDNHRYCINTGSCSFPQLILELGCVYRFTKPAYICNTRCTISWRTLTQRQSAHPKYKAHIKKWHLWPHATAATVVINDPISHCTLSGFDWTCTPDETKSEQSVLGNRFQCSLSLQGNCTEYQPTGDFTTQNVGSHINC